MSFAQTRQQRRLGALICTPLLLWCLLLCPLFGQIHAQPLALSFQSDIVAEQPRAGCHGKALQSVTRAETQTSIAGLAETCAHCDQSNPIPLEAADATAAVLPPFGFIQSLEHAHANHTAADQPIRGPPSNQPPIYLVKAAFLI